MARVVVQYESLGQVEAPTGTPQTVASLLGLSSDDECLKVGVILQADPSNGDEVYMGGVDANGTADAAQDNCIKLVANGGFAFEADENTGDEDQELYDIRHISLLAPISGQNVNVAAVKINSVRYNR